MLQVFPSNPRQWRPSPYDAETLAGFGEALSKARLPLYVHTVYLINLASPDEALRERSAGSLADALRFGALTGASGIVTHVGSHRGDGFERGLARVVETVARAYDLLRRDPPLGGSWADERPTSPRLLFESSAGGGDSLGRSPEELGRLVRETPQGPGVCLDTAHLFAAGYPLHTAGGLEAFLAELEAAECLEDVLLVHLNDSKTDLGSRSDRHENLWDGRFGRAGLRHVFAHPRLRSAPFVLEVPGADGRGPDRRNIRRARILRREAGGNI